MEYDRETEWFEEFDTAEEFNKHITRAIEWFVRHKVERVRAKDIRLDQRIGHVFKTSDAIMVHKSNQRTIEYYGGFEYIDKDHVVVVGDYVMYLLVNPKTGEEDSRIARCLGKDEED